MQMLWIMKILRNLMERESYFVQLDFIFKSFRESEIKQLNILINRSQKWILINCIHAKCEQEKHTKTILNSLYDPFAAEMIFKIHRKSFWTKKAIFGNHNEIYWELKTQFQEHIADCRNTKSSIVTSLVFQKRLFSIYFIKFDMKKEQKNELNRFFSGSLSMKFHFENQIA